MARGAQDVAMTVVPSLLHAELGRERSRVPPRPEPGVRLVRLGAARARARREDA
jgi:hypothetical protein